MRVSLIIPVYNAEKTLPAMLEAVSAQTFRDFEAVFSDDASTDGSAALLDAFAMESGLACKVLHAPKNGGAAAARNLAMEAAEGEYLAFADADDLLAPQMLGNAVKAAGGADIVGWDWTLGLSDSGRYLRQADYETAEQALLNLTGGTMRWNLWLFLVRRELVKDIRFIPGADMGEDMQFMLRAFLQAKTVVQLHESLYHYNNTSESSISRAFSDLRRFQVETNLAAVEKSFSASTFSREHPMALTDLKLFLKRPLLISANKKDYELWYTWFPETNGRARERAALPAHTYILQKMAAGRCWFGVKLYYLLIHKLAYGLFYR